MANPAAHANSTQPTLAVRRALVSLSALVLVVVVLITTLTGAGQT